LFKKVLTTDKITGAKIKAINPLTLKPGTRIEANQKHKPLTTNENAPKLRIFRGKDAKERIGLIPELTIPIAAAAIKAAGKFAKFTPGKIISTTNKLRAVANKVKSVANIVFSLMVYKW
jgi:hypothetical protein